MSDREYTQWEREEDSRQALDAQRRWEGHIASLIAMGARDAATALRWDFEANDVGAYGPGYYCFLNGLDYTLEHRIAEMMD